MGTSYRRSCCLVGITRQSLELSRNNVRMGRERSCHSKREVVLCCRSDVPSGQKYFAVCRLRVRWLVDTLH